jgi:atypical dual specificity phosphatase
VNKLSYPFFQVHTILENQLYSGMRLRRQSDIILLHNKGIKTIVSLKETTSPEYLELLTDFEFFHVPIADFSIPTQEQINDLLEIIRTKPPVFIHCHAGLGRTGTICALVVMEQKKLDAQSAIQQIRAIVPGSIESQEQENFILGYSSQNNLR